MKKVSFTLLSIGLLAFAACKKGTPTTTANSNGNGTENCSLCVGDILTLNDTGYVSNSYAQQVPYMHEDGTTAFYPSNKTPNGFYDYHGGMALQFNLANIDMACSVNKLSFVHARNVTNTNANPSEINLWLPNVPLMTCAADSLPAALAPWGYTATVYHGNTQVHQDSTASFAGIYDSIVVTGPAFTSVRIGANLFESELRSICFSHQ